MEKLEAEFVSTKRNGIAREFLPSHGFVKKGERWLLSLSADRHLPPRWVETEVLN